MWKTKILTLVFCLIAFCINLSAQQIGRISGWAEQGGFQPSAQSPAKVQKSFPNATITVYVSGTLTLATIYSNTALTPKANPFTADSNAHWFFYAANGSYDVKFSGTGISSPFTQTYELDSGLTEDEVTTIATITSSDIAKLQSIEKLNSTNLFWNWNFYEYESWGTNTIGTTNNGRAEFKALLLGAPFNTPTATAIMHKPAATDSAQVTYAKHMPIIPTKKYRWGVMAGGNGTDTINFGFESYDDSFSHVAGGGVAVTATPIALNLFTTSNGDVGGWINAFGGAAPAFSSTSISSIVPYINLNTAASGGNMFLFYTWMVNEDKLPTTDFIATSAARGTHEAAVSGTELYVVSHSFQTVVRYDKDLNRQAIATTDQYPHDVMIFNNFVWVVNYTGATLNRFDKTTLANKTTYPLLGGRRGFGLTNDGTDIYIGAGEGGTDAILKFNPSTAVAGTTTGQTVLSTDVLSVGTNISLQFIAGSVWGNNFTNGTVKRINPTTGATIATINPGMGKLYGIGSDGISIYANSIDGISRISTVDNTIISKHVYKNGKGAGGTNLKFDGNRRIWGGSGTHIVYLDTIDGVLFEKSNCLCKWVQPMEDVGVFAGPYSFPHIDKYAPIP